VNLEHCLAKCAQIGHCKRLLQNVQTLDGLGVLYFLLMQQSAFAFFISCLVLGLEEVEAESLLSSFLALFKIYLLCARGRPVNLYARLS